MIKTLRFWIMLLLTFTMIGILGITSIAGYFVVKENVVDNTLKMNNVFSAKLAQLTEEVFEGMQSQLQVKAFEVSTDIDDAEKLTEELDVLLSSNKNFNSLSVVNRDGVVLATAPDVGIVGSKLETPGPKEALYERKNLISVPYQAATGRLLILISTPLWNAKNEYLGFLSGTIYLQEENSIRDILGDHYATDGSYVWVVDRNGMIIYHPVTDQIGTSVVGNDVAQKIMRHESGAQKVLNSYGQEYLAGYTFIKASKWGVVSQTPIGESVKSAADVVSRMLMYALPFVIFFFFVTILLTNGLASPLRKLALYSASLREGERTQTAIPTWYFEAKQLNETIREYAEWQQQTVDEYKERSYTDALTGLKNRRYQEEMIAKWIRHKKPFSLIMIDIDHFKQVNDTYGHQVGDEVLKFLAEKMCEVVRSEDVCVRLGGEEFVMLLAETDHTDALKIAERLRRNVSAVVCPTNDIITVSLGVGSYYDPEETVDHLFERVDKALYRAKTEGRNRVVLAEE